MKMKQISIVKKQILNNEYIIFPSSYMNPLTCLNKLEQDLSADVKGPCFLLVDLLLCNGANFNRFVTLRFDGTKIDKQSIDTIKLSADDENKVNQFYREDKRRITRGVLVPSQYMKYVK